MDKTTTALLTSAERQIMAETGKFTDLCEIALAVCRRVPVCGEKGWVGINEVCGPITTGGFGNYEQNLAFFGFAIDELMKRGFWVFDQRPFEEAFQRILKERLHRRPELRRHYPYDLFIDFYFPIFAARIDGKPIIGHGLFLPNGESSTGTRMEGWAFDHNGIPNKDYPPEWLAGFDPPAVPVDQGKLWGAR